MSKEFKYRYGHCALQALQVLAHVYTLRAAGARTHKSALY